MTCSKLAMYFASFMVSIVVENFSRIVTNLNCSLQHHILAARCDRANICHRYYNTALLGQTDGRVRSRTDGRNRNRTDSRVRNSARLYV